MTKKPASPKNIRRRKRIDGDVRGETVMSDNDMSDLGDALKTIFGHKIETPYRRPENKPSVADSQRRWRMVPTKKSPKR